MLGAIDQGLITALLALGIFLTFRILNFADLTVDGSFTTGSATAAIIVFNGSLNGQGEWWWPWLATVAGIIVGALAGCLTGLLHTKAHIDPLLASILVMLALYSINSRILSAGYDGVERSNIGLVSHKGQPIETLFTWMRALSLRGSLTSIAVLGGIVVVFVLFLNWFLSTKFGLAIMATGDNPTMASAMGVSTDFTKIITLMVSNGLAGLSGAITAQYVFASSLEDGRGMILVGLASVILGNAIFGTRYVWLMTIGVVAGSVLYRIAIFWALRWDFLKSADMKLISAVLVIIALVLSQWQGAHALVTKISPWKPKEDTPEPMASVPNQFSPFAEVDTAHQPVLRPAHIHHDVAETVETVETVETNETDKAP
ncbi:MAG: ABC transporter permease [Propionibacteriaceae bacterium]|nr:ABC transporter permease [Propionibacteriaceae bacterium]